MRKKKDKPPVPPGNLEFEPAAFYICTKKCFFDGNMYEVDAETGYIPGIEDSEYFSAGTEADQDKED